MWVLDFIVCVCVFFCQNEVYMLKLLNLVSILSDTYVHVQSSVIYYLRKNLGSRSMMLLLLPYFSTLKILLGATSVNAVMPF
jgi:hypothetical protein